MKKILTLMAFVLLMMPAMSQMWVTVTGTLTDTQSGNPIPNYPVTIVSDSTNGFVYYNTVYTNTNGYYADSLWGTTSWGLLNINVWDCNQVLHQDTCMFAFGNTYFVRNFSICYVNTPTCNAEFTWNAAPPLTVYFTDLSTNPQSIWFWNFGDGTTAWSQNPVHTYASPGTYTVGLMIGDSTVCSDYVTHSVVVQDSTGGGCQAYYTFFPDSINPLLIRFFDASAGNIASWSWIFGDPQSGVNNTSNLENPTHQYLTPGTYTVCLTVQGTDSLCYDTYCATIAVTAGGGCQAYYISIPDSNAINTFYFVDQSQGNPATWQWNFDDPASGVNNYSTLQNSVHTFSQPGTYSVCLTIQGFDSLCYDTYCSEIVVGGGGNCQAQFTYWPDSSQAQGTLIHFLDLSSGTPTSWLWDFGDGSPNSTLQNPDHIYPSINLTYYVCLTIQCQGTTSTWCMNVSPGGGINCTSYFTYVGSGLTVSYDGNMVNGLPATYYWNFGDGQTGTGQVATHTYGASGIYYVTLSTVDTTGCQFTSGQSVMVGDSGQFYQVYGQVYGGNFPISAGFVMILGVDTSQNYFPFFDIANVDSLGVYYFPMVPTGDYYIYAIPFDSGQYLPTYYGDVLFWPQATVVTLPQPANPYDIHLVAAGYLAPGPGTITGQINTGDFVDGFIDKITMVLMDQQSNPVAYSEVDAGGVFQFTQLAYGTYLLHAEMAGCTSDLIQAALTEQNPDANIVLTFAGGHILGVNAVRANLDAGVVYPNPVSNEANINVRVERPTVLHASVCDMTGREVIRIDENVPAGDTRLRISVSRLTQGIYTLRITSGEGTSATKKLVISR